MKNNTHSRRQFIKKVLSGSAGVAALSSAQLSLMKSAMAQTSCTSDNPGEYKALVCVFLYGGNDSYNMLVPMRGDPLSDYQAIRQGLARTEALEIFPNSGEITGGLGFVPEMHALKGLFDSGKLAIQGNVGPLVEPIVRNGQVDTSVNYPKGLHAHDAQQKSWQRGAEVNQGNTASTGWSGRMLDSLYGAQGVDDYLRNVSLVGANTWQTGFAHAPYSLSAAGVTKLDLFYKWNQAGIRAPILENYMQNSQFSHPLEQAYSETLKAAENNARQLTGELAGVADLTTQFPESSLAEQLTMVTKLMRLGKEQGLTRQVFFVGMGGFDTHSGQVGTHPYLLETLSDSMASFYQATVEMEMENQITSFTMSDFGRTLTSNGDGTDHGWAGHQFVLGGAVNGDLYGDLPAQSTQTLQQFGGHMIPTTATEEMYASLALWFGLSRCTCDAIFPNLRNFVDMDQPLNIDYFSV